MIAPLVAPPEDLRHACILIADLDPAAVEAVRRVLECTGYTNLHGATTATQIGDLFARQDPDLLLLDEQMLLRGEYRLLDEIRGWLPPDVHLPILVLAGDASVEVKRQALLRGASDVLDRAADLFELCCRIPSHLRIRRLNQELHGQRQTLEARVRERTRELESAQLEILERLAHAAEFRDGEMGRHTRRVGALAGRIAEALGLTASEVERIRQAAPLHDVGKIAISDAILLKPGALTPEEFARVQEHTTIGAQMLAGGQTELLVLAEQIALYHHERWDGSGYPDGLSGEQIPLAARIVALADYVDSLSHERPYRPAWPMEQIFDSLRWDEGRRFDPRVVAAFFEFEHAAHGSVAASRSAHST